MHSWRILLLPYLEQNDLYHQYNFSEPWDGPNNRKLADRMPKMYAFHGEHHAGLTVTNYLAVVGPETLWQGRGKVTFSDVKDNLSSTILIVENRGANVHWMEPRDLSFAEMSFEWNSPAGVSSKYPDPAVAMLDGSLHRLRKTLSPTTLRALLTINGEEKLDGVAGEWILLPNGRQSEIKGP